MHKNIENVPKIWEPRIFYLTILAAIIGFISGFIALILYRLIGLITNIFYYGQINTQLAQPTNNVHLTFGPVIFPFINLTLGPVTFPSFIMIFFPVIGGFIAGLLIKYGSDKVIGHGIPEAMEASLVGSSKIRPEVGIFKAVASAFTIGTGEPFGAEGPIIQTGGAFGSFVAQLFPVHGNERSILLACGSTAGMAAVFGTPIAAVFLSIELLLFEFNTKSLVPIGVAAAMGAIMHFILITPKPFFVLPPYNYVVDYVFFPLFILLGILCGIIGVILTKSLYFFEDLFHKLPIGQPWSPALGGLFVGIIGFYVPEMLGVGYTIINGMLQEKYLLVTAIIIFLAKFLAWSIAMGSDTSGSTLAPLFLIGSSAGLAFGIAVQMIIQMIVPAVNVPAGIFAVAAMAAVFGAAARAPYTSIVFAIEITQQIQASIPIILTVLIANLIADHYLEFTLMTEKLARRGVYAHNFYEFNPWRSTPISRVMTNPVFLAEADEKAIDVARRYHDVPTKYPDDKKIIIQENGKLIGYCYHEYLYDRLAFPDASLTMKDICSKDFDAINFQESVFEAAKSLFFKKSNFVVAIDNNNKPIGYVTRRDLIIPWEEKIVDEYRK